MKTTLGCIRRADEDFHMIQPGDRIGVGVSGGKDSLLLLRALALYRYVRHHDFTMTALMLTMGREKPDTSAIEALCRELDVPIVIRHTEIYEILFEWRKDPNPCALCAKMRRGMLCDMCTDRGLNKLALGHHREDALETLMMSVIFEGRLHTFHPCSYMSRSNLTVIRPLMYVDEADVISFKNKYDLPVVKSKCPVDGHTKRQYAKELLKQLNTEHPGVRERMFHAILTGNISGWPERTVHERRKNS